MKAVLDWELCTVGDPLADVGLMIAYWNELGAVAGKPGALFREPVTAVPGFPAGERARRRVRARRRDAIRPRCGFWVAFAYWKVAIIVEGVYRRWLNDPGERLRRGRAAAGGRRASPGSRAEALDADPQSGAGDERCEAGQRRGPSPA